MEPNAEKPPRFNRDKVIFWIIFSSLLLLGFYIAFSKPMINITEYQQDSATLSEQAIHENYKEYRKREGKWPNSIQMLHSYFESPDYMKDPWGGEYQIEFRKNEMKGEEEPVIWTVDPKGKRIQWPRQ